MKKRFFALFLGVVLCFSVFAEEDGQEEVDFLLFLPNSGSEFVNEAQAMRQLDNMAAYLVGRNLVRGQIFAYGYAAAAVNDIEPVNLSRERALFVINELVKRGVPAELFSEPVAYGEVGIWGANTSEEDRIPNRRVRILLDGNFLTPELVKAADPEPIAIIAMEDVKVIAAAKIPDKAGSGFSWLILLPLIILALLALIAFLMFRNKVRPAPEPIREAVKEPVPQPTKIPPVYAPVAAAEITVNLEEEIRFRAYELYLERNGQSEDAYTDWCMAVFQVGSRYEDNGYDVYHESGSWWAKKTVRQ